MKSWNITSCKIWVLAAGFLLFSNRLWAQTPILERPVSLSCTRQPLWQVLDQLQQTYGLTFSYFNTPAALQSPVSIQAHRQPLKTVLDHLLAGSNLRYQLVEGQVVLKEIQPAASHWLRGKVIDRTTQSPLVAASVVAGRSTGTLTDAEGKFSIPLAHAAQSTSLTISFLGYQTVYLTEASAETGELMVALEPQSQVLDEVVVNEKGHFYLLPKAAADLLEHYEKDTIRFDRYAVAGELVIQGKVLEEGTRQPVLFCKVSLPGYPVKIVTSLDGTFRLSLPFAFRRDTLVFTSLIYQEVKVPIARLQSESELATVLLPKRQLGGEAVIAKLGEQRLLIEQTIANITRNYTDLPSILEQRYRETIKLSQSDLYLLEAEATMRVYKPPYRAGSLTTPDQVQITRSPQDKLMFFNPNRPGTEADRWPYEWMLHNLFSIDGLDVVKGANRNFFQSSYYAFFPTEILSVNRIRHYRFQLLDLVVLNGRPVYVIGFEPQTMWKTVYFQGRLYAEVESLALLRAEYRLTPGGLSVMNHPIDASLYPPKELIRKEHVVNYTVYEGRWSFDQASIESEYINYAENIPITSRVEFEVVRRQVGRLPPFRKSQVIRYPYQPLLYQVSPNLGSRFPNRPDGHSGNSR